ncbi:MAG: DUF2336 domain-containing protein [Alphaproteobacteria bacterium]|nr:DUF2336 domain-containing protein [Alphaproteobacteria bacterium]
MSLIADLEQLKSNASPKVKQQITEKITNYLDCNAFNDTEKKIALDILDIIVKDADKEIRKIVAKNLKGYADLSRNVSLNLANDIDDEVALPIIEFSTVLFEEDIIHIVESTKKLSRLVAVSKRQNLPEIISEKIVDRGIEEVTSSLIHNKTAKINDKSFNKIIKQYQESGEIMSALVDRGGLSPVTIEKLVSVVSDEMKRKLINEYKLPSDLAIDITNSSQEEVISKNFSITANKAHAKELIDHLYGNGKLSHSIILRALCKGDVMFFALALGKLAKIPEQFAENMVFNEGATSLAALYKKADMPKGCFEAVNILLRIIMKIIEAHPNLSQKDFSRELMQKIIDSEYDKKINMMSHFLMMISNQLNS